MGYCLAEPRRAYGEHREASFVKRFDPRFWVVNFPRPMMGCVVSTAHDAVRVDLAFTGRDNLAGLIWEAEDRWDHPLLAYATSRDFRQCQLRFRWRSVGVKPLDAVYGPVLTIEGRDAGGAARAWYVRLWNYAHGTREDAVVSIDFGDVNGGFLLPSEADPVWAGDVDRMFISMVPADYDGTAANYAAMADAWVELSGIACDGSGSVLALGDARDRPSMSCSLRIMTGPRAGRRGRVWRGSPQRRRGWAIRRLSSIIWPGLCCTARAWRNGLASMRRRCGRKRGAYVGALAGCGCGSVYRRVRAGS